MALVDGYIAMTSNLNSGKIGARDVSLKISILLREPV